ncbi:hypothetical protein DH2020_037796 [Rehmannia glutinosa]|uniref:Ribosome biogenesis protein NOP53 n=1 Tax=Rehmannia glutinosa TaxID=99300 RepID=A0ABR0V0D0_REHGL
MAKSMRSKREKRLRAIRRDLVEPIYDKKDVVKLAAPPKLLVKSTPSETSAAMEVTAAATTSSVNHNGIVEMANDNQGLKFLKPIGQKLKRNIKISKRKYRGKGKIRKKTI